MPSSFLMGFRCASRLGSLDARSAQSVNSDAHTPGRLLLPLCGNSPSVVRIYDQDHFAPAGAKMGCGREIFSGCTGVCMKCWGKSAQVSGLFLFSAGRGWEMGVRSPRGGAEHYLLPPDRCAGLKITKSGLGRFFHIIICYMYAVADNGDSWGFMSSCNIRGGLLQVCYRWGESVDLKFGVW